MTRRDSRNRILRQAFLTLGWQVTDFMPHVSSVAHIQAKITSVKTPDIVWVPAFRQRDVAAAARWATSRKIPLIFDPLISDYDKQVFECGKFSPGSQKGRKLLAWESPLLKTADRVIADTDGHAAFFTDTLNVGREKVGNIAVGAEEALFYGSFISLQAPHIIVEAAKRCSAPGGVDIDRRRP